MHKQTQRINSSIGNNGLFITTVSHLSTERHLGLKWLTNKVCDLGNRVMSACVAESSLNTSLNACPTCNPLFPVKHSFLILTDVCWTATVWWMFPYHSHYRLFDANRGTWSQWAFACREVSLSAAETGGETTLLTRKTCLRKHLRDYVEKLSGSAFVTVYCKTKIYTFIL